jgi:hypothetical protein
MTDRRDFRCRDSHAFGSLQMCCTSTLHEEEGPHDLHMIVCELVGCECCVEFAGVEGCMSLCTIASELIWTHRFDMPCASRIRHSFTRDFRDRGGAWVFGTQVRDAGKDMGGLGVHLLGEEELESEGHLCDAALQLLHSGLGLGNDWGVCIHGL